MVNSRNESVVDFGKNYVNELKDVWSIIDAQQIVVLLDLLEEAIINESNVFIIGNGGSASTASHWATDLGKGLFYRNGKNIKIQSLSNNTAYITAVANDIDYESIYSDQLRNLGKDGDLLISVSASGNSKNIIKAIEKAKEMNIKTMSLVGFDGGKALKLSDHSIHIPTIGGKYGIVEDIQLILNHFILEYLVKEQFQ